MDFITPICARNGGSCPKELCLGSSCKSCSENCWAKPSSPQAVLLLPHLLCPALPSTGHWERSSAFPPAHGTAIIIIWIGLQILQSTTSSQGLCGLGRVLWEQLRVWKGAVFTFPVLFTFPVSGELRKNSGSGMATRCFKFQSVTPVGDGVWTEHGF